MSSVLRYLRDSGPAGRSEIAAACDLGISTLTGIVTDLQRRGLVSEGAAELKSRTGRPVIPLSIDGDGWLVIGVQLDVDGVRLRMTTVGGDLRAEWHLEQQLANRPAEEGLRLVKQAVTRAVGGVVDRRRIVAVEVSIPGSVARDTGVVGVSVVLGWNNVDAGRTLRGHLNRLGLTHCHLGIDNDVNHAALAAIRTELSDVTNGCCIYFGGDRGVGGAILIDGSLFRGSHGGAGEFGHLPVEFPGRRCYCGRCGCLETRLSLSALLVDADLLDRSDAQEAVASDPHGARETLLAAMGRSKKVRDVVKNGGRLLGRAVEMTLGVLNPDVVLIGDNLAYYGEEFFESMTSSISTTIDFAAFQQTRFVSVIDVGGRVVRGAAIAAADVCLDNPVSLTFDISD